MQLNILIVGASFPAIRLMMINFGDRYVLLAGLILNLYDTLIKEKYLLMTVPGSSIRSPAWATACDFLQLSKPGVRLLLSLAYQLWFPSILASTVLVTGCFFIDHFDGCGNDSIHHRKPDCQFAPWCAPVQSKKTSRIAGLSGDIQATWQKISQSRATASIENFALNPSAHIRPLYFWSFLRCK